MEMTRRRFFQAGAFALGAIAGSSLLTAGRAFGPAAAWAAGVTVLPPDIAYLPRAAAMIDLGTVSSPDITVNCSNLRRVTQASDFWTGYDLSNSIIYNLDIPSLAPKQTVAFDRPIDLAYRRVASIGTGDIDVYITVDTLSVTNPRPKTSAATTLTETVLVYNTEVWLESVNDKEFTVQFEVSFNIVWSDTGQVVDLPFFIATSDLDISNAYGAETWEAGEGFDGSFFVFQGNNLVCNPPVFRAPYPGTPVDGNNRMFKAGVIALTNNGQFTCRYTENNCGTTIGLYSAYSIINNPVKSVEDASPYHKGDIVHYSVAQKMGTWWQDTYTCYTEMTLKDELPSGLVFVEGSVHDGEGNDITETGGTLTYDESAHAVIFELNDEWISDQTNYNGQDLLFEITCRVESILDPEQVIFNEAMSIISGAEYLSNEIPIIAHEPHVVTVHKRVKADEVVWSDGDPSFVLTLSCEETGDTRRALVVFTQDMEPDDDGFLCAEAKFENLDCATYLLTQEHALRYGGLGEIAGNGTPVDNGAAVELPLKSLFFGEVTSTSSRLTTDRLSDSGGIVNHIGRG